MYQTYASLRLFTLKNGPADFSHHSLWNNLRYAMSPETKQRIWKLTIWCALPLVYFAATVRYYSQLAPSNGVATYSQLKSQGVPLNRAVKVTTPANHICVFGDVTAGLWTFPSGPPAYLFDDAGQLVDYTCDVGESTVFQNDYGIYAGVAIDLNNVEEQFTLTPRSRDDVLLPELDH